MTPLPFVWPFAFFFWSAMVWAFAPEFAIIRRAQRSAGATDRRSANVIQYGQSAAMLAAYPLAWMAAFRIAPAHPQAPFWTGIGLLIAGSLLRRHCWRMLGSLFTGDVRASPDQEVVTRGAYRFVRHPSYTAGLLMNGGMGVALGSWASAVLLLGATFAVYVYRMHVEEQALLAAIGERYERFMATRKRLIPFVY